MITAILYAFVALLVSSVLAGISALIAQVDWRFGLTALVVCTIVGAALLLAVFLSLPFAVLLVVPFALGWGMPIVALAVVVHGARRGQRQARRLAERRCLRCGHPIPLTSDRCPECGIASS